MRIFRYEWIIIGVILGMILGFSALTWYAVTHQPEPVAQVERDQYGMRPMTHQIECVVTAKKWLIECAVYNEAK